MKRDRELTRLFRQEPPVDVQGKKKGRWKRLEKAYGAKRPVYIPTWQQIFIRSLIPFTRLLVLPGLWLLLRHLPSCGVDPTVSG